MIRPLNELENRNSSAYLVGNIPTGVTPDLAQRCRQRTSTTPRQARVASAKSTANALKAVIPVGRNKSGDSALRPRVGAPARNRTRA